MLKEEVCAMDDQKGPLVVKTDAGAPTVRLALQRGDNKVVYATYTRTEERDVEGRPIYR